ncbi:hypothetical protein CR205_00990 [Alteribacter lacisalsi]|uniref:Uncharacterized protein n=1 Tax=Alteribacter lacisalsi TaxID=2045244 RepID=A0A2W0HK73_9BACI|nr:hypothetical protein [Alteribacter lacisalsi]PYZ97209.1 hypothetical protein CR205_00990 [Alteribacter lacisalsi]
MPKKTKMSAGLYDNEGETATHNQLMDSYYQHSPEHETYNEEMAQEPHQDEKQSEKKNKKKRKK